jgi:hypothetical protein
MAKYSLPVALLLLSAGCSLSPYRSPLTLEGDRLNVTLTPNLDARSKQGLISRLDSDSSSANATELSTLDSTQVCWAIYARSASTTDTALGSSSAFDACDLSGLSSAVGVIEAGSSLSLDQLPAGTHQVDLIAFTSGSQTCSDLTSLNSWPEGHSTEAQKWLRYLWTLSETDRYEWLSQWYQISSASNSSTTAPEGWEDALQVHAFQFASFTVSAEATVELDWSEASLTRVPPVCGSATPEESAELGSALEIAFEDSSSSNASAGGAGSVGVGGAQLTCPSGFVGIPGDNWLGSNSFCVMKTEAKELSGIPSAQPTSGPWTGISLENSRIKCQTLQTGAYPGTYDLISNLEWMTIARNIENVSANWSGGAPGNGNLNRGHSDSSPSQELGLVNINDSFSGTGNSALNGSTWGDQKRTHTLSTGDEIWDFSGNVDEWVIWDPASNPISTSIPFADKAYYSNDGAPVASAREFSLLNVSTSAGALMKSATWQAAFTSLTSAHGIGTYQAGTNSPGVPIRGGHWADAANAGIYRLSLDANIGYTYTTVGFRCVYRP